MAWDWTDARPIGEALYDAHPDTHPLQIRYTDLHKWVTQLPEFGGDPKGSSEKHLEAIQMIWYEEWQEDHE